MINDRISLDCPEYIYIYIYLKISRLAFGYRIQNYNDYSNSLLISNIQYFQRIIDMNNRMPKSVK